jgi:hypothetical protein
MRLKLGIKRTVSIGLAVAALSALAAISAASASAAKPEFVGPTGPITVKGEPSTYLELAGGSITQCREVSGSGAITGKKTGNVTLLLSSCTALPGFCHGKGLLTTEMKTVELEMIPVYTLKTGAVGIELRPKVGTKFAELSSPNGAACELKGSLLAIVTPERRRSSKFTLKFSGERGTQTPSQYENETHEAINSWLEFRLFPSEAFEKESWSGNLTMSTTKEIEIG